MATANFFSHWLGHCKTDSLPAANTTVLPSKWLLEWIQKKVVKPGCLALEQREELNYTRLTLVFIWISNSRRFPFHCLHIQSPKTKKTKKQNPQQLLISINNKMSQTNLSIRPFFWEDYKLLFKTTTLNQCNKCN